MNSADQRPDVEQRFGVREDLKFSTYRRIYDRADLVSFDLVERVSFFHKGAVCRDPLADRGLGYLHRQLRNAYLEYIRHVGDTFLRSPISGNYYEDISSFSLYVGTDILGAMSAVPSSSQHRLVDSSRTLAGMSSGGDLHVVAGAAVVGPRAGASRSPRGRVRHNSWPA